MKTTQDAFSALRGHVADGCEVLMNNGDTVRIQASMQGWNLYVVTGTGLKFHANAGPSAHVVECLVYVYPSLEI